jgi:hypothetical protein
MGMAGSAPEGVTSMALNHWIRQARRGTSAVHDGVRRARRSALIAGAEVLEPRALLSTVPCVVYGKGQNDRIVNETNLPGNLRGGDGADLTDLTRRIDKRSQMFDMIRQNIDNYNLDAQGIINSLGR